MMIFPFNLLLSLSFNLLVSLYQGILSKQVRSQSYRFYVCL